MNKTPRYSVLIEWSDRDQAFLVRLPEWERAGVVRGPVTHGDTYEEASRNAQDAIEALVDSLLQHGEALPEPHVFAGVQ